MNSPAKQKIPMTVIMLGVVSFLTDASSEMIYPLIPIFVAALGSGAVILGVIEGVAESTASLLKLATGVLSDKMRKRRLFVLLGYGISGLSRPLVALATQAWQIVFIRMSDRVGKGIRTAPRDALIAQAVDEGIRGKAYGFHRAMDHAGAVAGPFLALSILMTLFLTFKVATPVTALRIMFGLALVPGILAFLTIVFFIKEDSPGTSGNGTFKFSLAQFDRNYIRYLFIIILFTLGNSSDAFLLFRASESVHQSGALLVLAEKITPIKAVLDGFGDVQSRKMLMDILLLPLVWAFFHVIKVVFSTPFGSLSDRVGRKLVISIGWGVYAAVYLAFAFLDRMPREYQLPAIFVLFAVYALYYALTEGVEKAFVADMVPVEMSGSAFGMYNFSVGLAALPASVIFGLLYNYLGGAAAFGFGSFLAVCSMLALALLVKEKRR